MKRVVLSEVSVKGDKILYEVRQDSGAGLLKQDIVELFVRFHCGENVSLNLEQIPLSMLAIPISLYLLPLTYFYKVEVVLPVVDKELYEQLPKIYAAYAKMYGPFQESWRGRLTVKKVVDTPLLQTGTHNNVVFFSGGVDACSAGINNPGAKTLLVSIPDIETQAKNEGPLREEKFSLIKRFAKIVDSDWVLISNNFNVSLYRDHEINHYLKEQLGLSSAAFQFDGWAGIKYLANMCCAAPLAYALGIKRFIMGSAFEPIEETSAISNDGAHPSLSDTIRFAGIGFAEQDELYTRRSAKVRKIIEWCSSHNENVKMWVCFRDGSAQCGVCNKCVRTQLNILCVSEDPRAWGFDNFDEKEFVRLIKSYRYLDTPCWHWDIDEAIDAHSYYPYCNDLLHWLKRIGYKEYRRRAIVRSVWCRRLGYLRKLVWVHKYPRYVISAFRKLLRYFR